MPGTLRVLALFFYPWFSLWKVILCLPLNGLVHGMNGASVMIVIFSRTYNVKILVNGMIKNRIFRVISLAAVFLLSNSRNKDCC